MIISIASGKGGTGKTTVATNLALVLGERVELLDCDVEEPTAHLFLKPQIERTERVDGCDPLGITSTKASPAKRSSNRACRSTSFLRRP